MPFTAACTAASLPLGLVERLLETVEQQVEAELELPRVVVAGTHDVLRRELREVRVLVHGEARQDRLREFGGLLRSAQGQDALGHREPVDVAVERRIGVGDQEDGESGSPEASDDRVVVTKV